MSDLEAYGIVDTKMIPFALGLPNDMTCWDIGIIVKHSSSHAEVVFEMYRFYLTARARGIDDELYVMAEWEKGLSGHFFAKAKRQLKAKARKSSRKL